MDRLKGKKSRTIVSRKRFQMAGVKNQNTIGVWLSIEPELSVNLNYKEKTEKVWNVLKNW